MRQASSPQPRATIVIPNWNGARFLPACLAAISGQRLGEAGAFETIVVDNGSTDESLAILERAEGVRLLAMPCNLGFAGAVNVGIRAARAPIIVLLNNDTEVQEGWLAALLAAFEGHPRLGMAGSKVLLHSQPHRLHTTGDTLSRSGAAGNRGVWEKDRGQFDRSTEVFGVNAASAAYRRELFEDIGWFEEAFGSYMEDVDLAWRARLAGWRAAYVPDSRVLHHLSATGAGPLASFLVARNRILMIARCYPGRLLLRNLPRVVGAQLRIAVDALRAWRGAAARATLRGQLAGLVGWPAMLPARRRILGARRIDDAAMAALFDG